MADDEPISQIPETIATYFRLRGLKPSARRLKRRKRRVDDENQPFTAGRDPRGSATSSPTTSPERPGWNGRLSPEELILRWSDVAGARHRAARHAGWHSRRRRLTVSVIEAAWAKQLQYSAL